MCIFIYIYTFICIDFLYIHICLFVCIYSKQYNRSRYNLYICIYLYIYLNMKTYGSLMCIILYRNTVFVVVGDKEAWWALVNGAACRPWGFADHFGKSYGFSTSFCQKGSYPDVDLKASPRCSRCCRCGGPQSPYPAHHGRTVSREPR